MDDQLKLISKKVSNMTSLTFSSSEIDDLTNFSTGIDRLILSKLNQKFSGRCVGNGFVLSNFITIKNKSEIYFPHESLQVSYKIDVEFSSQVVNPDVGTQLKMKIETTNKIGFLGTLHESPMSPLIFLCPQDLTKNKDIFKAKSEGDIVTAKIIGSKFEQNDKKITVIAEIME